MAHWDAENPWRDGLVYVPIEELAEALSGGQVKIGRDGNVVERTAKYNLERWRKYGDKLDAYVLPSSDGLHSAGVRYGPEGDEYLSPAAIYPEKLDELVSRYRDETPKINI